MAWSTLIHRVADVVVTDTAPEAFDALAVGTPLIRYAAPAGADDDAMGAVFEGDGWPEVARVDDTDSLLEQLRVAADGGFARRPAGDRHGVVPLDGRASWRFAQRLRGLDLG